MQSILKENHAMGEPMIGYERENTPRVPLGIVPVEEDGSVYFEGPVAKGLIFQPLDEDYTAVTSMRSTALPAPRGERLSCTGLPRALRASAAGLRDGPGDAPGPLAPHARDRAPRANQLLPPDQADLRRRPAWPATAREAKGRAT